MSVAEILNELPNLTPADLLVVRRKLMELAEENSEMAPCDASAPEGVQIPALLDLAAHAEPMGVLTNAGIDQAIYGV